MEVASAESGANLSGSVAASEDAARAFNVARQRAAPATAPVLAAPAPADSSRVPEDMAAYPQRWAERIARLRAAGQTAQADEELKQLRARYPDFVVPTAAQR